MEHRYFRVGSGAGATGLIILELSNGSTLSVFVIPKFWGAAKSRAEIDLDDLVDMQRDVAVVVPEFTTIRLASTRSELLHVCASKLTGLTFDDNALADDEIQEVTPPGTRRMSSFLIETVRPSGFDQFAPLEASDDQVDERVMRFWAGVDQAGAADLVRMAEGSDIDAPVLIGRKLVRSIPGLQMALWRLFVTETERVLRRRTPDFRERQDVLPFVRGALTRAGRFNASVGDWTRLECKFSELDNDHDWQRLIRSGIRETSSHLRSRTIDQGDAELLRRCRRIDVRMSDVTPLDRSATRPIHVDVSHLGKNRHAIFAARLAAAVLGGSIDAGHKARNPKDVAIATGLRVPTSRLFERMLAGCLDDRRGLQLVANHKAIALRKGEKARKLPDLLLVDPSTAFHSVASAVAVVDAKYKLKLPGSLSQMPMGDQYQQFAYAVVSSRPTLFLYAAAPDARPGLVGSALANGPQPNLVLGMASVPFPGPNEESWPSALEASLGDTIKAFVRLISEENRRTA